MFFAGRLPVFQIYNLFSDAFHILLIKKDILQNRVINESKGFFGIAMDYVQRRLEFHSMART